MSRKYYLYEGHFSWSFEAKLFEMIQNLHSLTTKELYCREKIPGRTGLWQNFRETHLTFQRSYLARRNYVHRNAAHHGLVRVGSDWKWCSVKKFKEAVTPAWLKTIPSFKYDEIPLGFAGRDAPRIISGSGFFAWTVIFNEAGVSRRSLVTSVPNILVKDKQSKSRSFRPLMNAAVFKCESRTRDTDTQHAETNISKFSRHTKMIHNYLMILVSGLTISALQTSAFLSADELYVSQPLTEVNSFTSGFEGPAVDRHGNFYAVNFGSQHTIGKVSLDGKAELFVTLPGKSIGNGLRFDRDGFLYVADYPEHNVLRIDPKTQAITVFAHQPKMNQPNDLAITKDGVLYASDPSWEKSTDGESIVGCSVGIGRRDSFGDEFRSACRAALRTLNESTEPCSRL